MNPAPAHRTAPYLRYTTIVAMILPLVAACVVESPIPLVTRIESAILWAMSLFPAFSYFTKQVGDRRPFPFLAFVGLLYGLYYAISPAFGSYNQHQTILLSPQRDYDDAVFTALAGWVVLLLGYAAGKLLLPPRQSLSNVKITDSRLRKFAAALMLAGLLLDTMTRVYAVPTVLAGLLTFLTSLGSFGSAILICLAVQRRLTFPYRVLSYLGAAGFVFLSIGNGLLSPLALYGAVVVLAAWIGYGRFKFSWTVMAVAGAIFVISMRGVTNQYRMLMWRGADDASLLSKSTTFVSLLQKSVETDGLGSTVTKGLESTEERSANLDVLADVIRRTPTEIPYWGGATYLSLVGLAIPRFLWPDKPTKELGQGFGHRYGYLSQNDERTSLNLPVLVEFYANFGIAGVLLGMWLVGLIYYIVNNAVNNPGQDMLVSLAGIVLITPLLNIESDFSLTFGGLIMNGAALAVVLSIIRRSASTTSAPASSRQSFVTLTAPQRTKS